MVLCTLELMELVYMYSILRKTALSNVLFSIFVIVIICLLFKVIIWLFPVKKDCWFIIRKLRR